MSFSIQMPIVPAQTSALPQPPIDGINKTLPAELNPNTMPQPIAKKGLKDYLVSKLNEAEAKLDHLIPINIAQKNFDKVIKAVNGEIFPQKFTAWLNDNGKGTWFEQLGTFLSKLPVRVAVNIVRQLYNLIKTILSVPAYALMHPMKVPIKIAKMLIQLVNALTQPETWSKIGVGVMGSTFGQMAVASNPIAVIAMGIGGALALAGITVGTIKTAVLAEKSHRDESVKSYLLAQAKQLPEDFLTGYCMILLLEGIQQTTRGIQRCFQKMRQRSQHSHDIQTSQRIMTDQQVQAFLKEHNYPMYEAIDRNGTTFTIRWKMDHAVEQDFISKLSRELPDAKFVIKTCHTGTEYHTELVWKNGYFDYNKNWVPGYLDTVTVPIPIYEKFVGYQIDLKGWVAPPMPLLPPAMEIRRQAYQLLGAGQAINDCVEQTSLLSVKKSA